MAIEIRRIINTPVDSNCYILFDSNLSDECVIIDPGSRNNETLIRELKVLNLIPRYIILTHEHYDHCWGVNGLTEHYPRSAIVCTHSCSEAIADTRRNYSHYCCSDEFTINHVDIIIEQCDWMLTWLHYNIIFISSKGHTSSGVYILLGNYLFSGDTLIKGQKTITKFKTGSTEELKRSIEFLSSCKDRNYRIYPGHGESFLLSDYDLTIALEDVQHKVVK